MRSIASILAMSATLAAMPLQGTAIAAPQAIACDLPVPRTPAPEPDVPPRADARSKRLHPPIHPAAGSGIEGSVVVVADIDADGRVTEATIEKSGRHRPLDMAARDAVRQWRFSPAMKDGRAVAWRARIPVRFEGDGRVSF